MTNKSQTAEKKLTTKHVILILGALIIICAAVVTAIFFMTREIPDEMTPVANAGNLEDIKSQVQDKVSKGMFMTHMNTTWVFPDGKSASSNAVMGNSSANNYPFWFTLKLADTDEVLYKSGTLPVGQQLSEIKLDKDLAKGDYPAVINIQMVDENGTDVESNMAFNITLTVEK